MAEPKFDILSELANNPGLKHISENICLLLDLKTLFSCRRVQRSWNEFLNDPRSKSSQFIFTYFRSGGAGKIFL